MKNTRLFIVCLFIVICTERLEKTFYVGFFDLYPSRLLFVFLLQYFSTTLFLEVASKEVKSIFYTFLLFTFFVFLSVFKSNDFFYSFKKWLDSLTIHAFVFITYSFLAVSVKSWTTEEMHRFFLRNFVYILIAVFIGGLFFYDTIGTSAELEERSFGGIAFYRRTSFFRDPNFYGCFLILSFFIIYFSSIPYRKTVLFFIFFSLFLTGSKGAIGGLCFTLILYYRSKIPVLRNKIILYLLIIVISLGTIILMTYPYEVFDSLADSGYFQNQLGAETILPRILTWHSGMKAYLNEPILGIGPGNIVNIAKGQSIESLLLYVQSNGFYGLEYDQIDKLATHSFYLEILFESGLLAFIFYILYLYKILKLMIDYSNFYPSLFRGLTLGLISFFLSVIFLSYNTYYLNFLIGLSLFLIDKKRKEVFIV